MEFAKKNWVALLALAVALFVLHARWHNRRVGQGKSAGMRDLWNCTAGRVFHPATGNLG